ncbi:MAG: SUMF1/EgtB/PvdO family nonheme iron enzyme [Planctomycetota bacterium]|nr:SUMF1/EgtB/PvdO family nonheme iron enzyme [Planctomycetota bacterium]
MTLAALLLLGCGGEGSPGLEGTRALYELERLVFVPAGPCRLEGWGWDCALKRSIVFDVYEVTREDWSYTYGADAARSRWKEEGTEIHGDTGDWPADFSFVEALELARQRGMRLPTAREWVHVATGRRSHNYPWGSDRQFPAGHANTLKLALDRPTPVGTFENGRSKPFGCYDMLGNVMEWVAGEPVPEYMPREGPIPDDLRSAMGGSYLSDARYTFGEIGEGPGVLAFNAINFGPDHRALEIGVRMCADAETYLWRKAPEWGTDEDARRRVAVVGQRWAAVSGQSALVLLVRELQARPDTPPALAWLIEDM